MSKKKKHQKYIPKPPPPAPMGHPPYNVNGEGGRPKKWDESKLDEMADLLNQWLDKAIEEKKEWWWKDWAFEVGMNPDKAFMYAAESARFRSAYERAKVWQAHTIEKYALIKKFSEGFSKFLLINNHPDKYRDRMSKDDAKDILKEAAQLVKDTGPSLTS